MTPDVHIFECDKLSKRESTIDFIFLIYRDNTVSCSLLSTHYIVNALKLQVKSLCLIKTMQISLETDKMLLFKLYDVLFNSILAAAIFYSILFCSVLSYPVLSCSVHCLKRLFWPNVAVEIITCGAIRTGVLLSVWVGSCCRTAQKENDRPRSCASALLT